MNITFTNGVSYNYTKAVETEGYFNGSNRRTLTITADPNVISVDTLHKLVSDEENTKSITLSNENISNVYSGYVLEMSVGIKNELVEVENETSPAQYTPMLVLELGKRTYIEEQLHALGVL